MFSPNALPLRGLLPEFAARFDGLKFPSNRALNDKPLAIRKDIRYDLLAPDCMLAGLTKYQSGVAILLSTRNGAAHLTDQLKSLLAQTHVDWQLFWRDDGSVDRTPDIIRKFTTEAGDDRVVDLNDDVGNIGITASFLSLLRRAPRNRMVAFADQDDVWLPDKLARGVASLRQVPMNQPALYCARQHLVGPDLSPIRLSAPVRGPTSFPHALTQNIATGCTVMLNQRAARLLAEAEAPVATLHDWWAYILISAAGGEIIVDEEATVLYRQHALNAVGAPLSQSRRAWAALRRGPAAYMRAFRANTVALGRQKHLLSREARSALALISDMPHQDWILRLRALRCPGLRRETWAETQLFRLWYMLG